MLRHSGIEDSSRVSKYIVSPPTIIVPRSGTTTVVRMLTFHAAAGGRGYTGLNQDVHPSLDFTRHLDLGRAILFAEVELLATDIQLDGQAAENITDKTFVRILLPVERQEVRTRGENKR